MSYFNIFTTIVLCAFSVQALELEKQPLRNLNIQDTQLKLDSAIYEYADLNSQHVILQNGKALFIGMDLDENKPYCTVSEIRSLDPTMPARDFSLEVWGIEGKYSDLFTKPTFTTEIRTNGIAGLMKIICHKPSAMAFNEMTIGEFEATVSPYVILTKVGADITGFSVKPNFNLNLPMNLDPSFIYEPEKNLFTFMGRTEGTLGITIEKELTDERNKWNFQNGKVVEDYDIKSKLCTLRIRSDKPVTLKKGTFLKTKSISAHYEKNKGLPGDVLSKYFTKFRTVVTFVTPEDIEAVMICSPSASVTPLTYNDTVVIFGPYITWTGRN